MTNQPIEKITIDKSKGEEFILRCGRCNTETWHIVHSSVDQRISYGAYDNEDFSYDEFEWYERTYQIIQCQGCKGLKFRLRKTDFVEVEKAQTGELKEGESIYTEEIYPKHSELEPMGILLSKATFEKDLQFMFREAKQNDSALALIIGDIDKFKDVNEVEGHDAGDIVLKVIMELLKAQVKGKGKAYRFGGEELTILLSNYSLEEAEFFANHVRERISQLRIQLAERKNINVTMSFGVAASEDFDDSNSFFKGADEAVRTAKLEGRNKVCAMSSS